MNGVKSPLRSRYSADPESIRHVRRWVTGVGKHWRLAEVETLVLLASELATNAVLHARTDYEVELVMNRDVVRLEVKDYNTRLPAVASVPVDAVSGRGLLIVEALASAWGIEKNGDGKVVWFEVPALHG